MRRGFFSTCVLLACTLFAAQAVALDPQKAITQFTHRSWGAADGISTVCSIAQTTDGYIWIATTRGTFRFDGLHFTRLEPDLNGPRPTGGFYHLLGARDGSLWISRGEFVVRRKAGKVTVYGPKDGLPDHDGAICEDHDGTIWVQTGSGLARFTGERWEPIGEESGLPRGEVHSLLVDHENTLWVAIQNAQQKPSYPVAFLRRGETRFHVAGYAETIANGMAQAPNRAIWMAQTARSVRAFVPDQSEIHFIPPEIKVGSVGILFDRDGSLWITTAGDGLRRARNTASLGREDIGQFSDSVDKFTQKDGLSSDLAMTVFEDREGNIWIGTLNGLDCFSETKVTSLSCREGLPFDQSLWLEATRDGSIWAGSTPRGFEQIKNGEKQFVDWKWFDLKAAGGTFMTAHSIYRDPEGSLILGTDLGVITVQGGGSAAAFLPGAQGLKGVMAMTREPTGVLWLCADTGVYRLQGDQLERVSDPRLANGIVYAAYTDRRGRVWLCFQSGVVTCYEGERCTSYSAREGLFSGAVLGIFEDTKGQIWCTGRGGISRFANGCWQTLSRANGLPDEDIFAAVLDDQGSVWLGGWSGLFRAALGDLESALSATTDQVKGESFELPDGLRGPVHGTVLYHGKAGAAKGPDGRLWFATGTGLAIVDPRHISRNPLPPPVHIQQIQAGGKTYQAFEHLELPIGSRNCEIDYVGLSYVNPAKVRYQYKLEGYDQEWIEAGSRRQAFYSNLKPQKYGFRVRACNNDGVWNETGDRVTFSILPAFYERSWFRLFCVLLAALALWGLYRLRLARITTRMKQQLQGQIKERKRIARELHDTLLQGFTGVGLKLDALAGSMPDSTAPFRDRLQKILNQSDQYLAEARRSIWELRATSLENADDFSRTLSEASARILESTEIQLVFSVSGEPRKLEAGVEDHLLHLCEEAVSNAVKHARPSEIKVSLEFGRKEVRLHISDNGCGFDPNGPEAIKVGHFGLVGMRERVEALCGTFALRSDKEAGTEIVATIHTSR